jgi:hypothetical protein
VPVVTGGEVTVSWLDVTLLTVQVEPAAVVQGMTTLPLTGEPPLSSTKLTEVALGEKPVPLIVIAVPPAIVGTGVGLQLRLCTTGTTGDQSQLFTVILVPQYVTHWLVVGV